MPGGISYIGDLTVVEDGGEITSQSVGDKALKSTCADADTIEVNSSTGKLQVKTAGSSKSNGVGRDDVSKFAGMWLQGALSADDAAGGVFAVENTYGTDLVVLRVVIQLTTGSSGACTIDIGAAADATTSADTLIDGLSLADEGIYDNIYDRGTNGASRIKFGSGAFITASMASGATAGIVGQYAIYALDMN
jgi:hypothetical protein